MDGRARYDPDEALVISLCETDEYGDAVMMACIKDEEGELTFVGLVG
jgi:hypothetical protein